MHFVKSENTPKSVLKHSEFTSKEIVVQKDSFELYHHII